MANISYSYVPDRGWTGKGFSIEHEAVEPAAIDLTLAPRGKEPVKVAIKSVEASGGLLKIDAEEFDYRSNWTLTVGNDKYTRKEMDEECCEGLEVFEKKKDGGKQPLVVVFQGGGLPPVRRHE